MASFGQPIKFIHWSVKISFVDFIGDLKAANQDSAKHITVYAEEGISFLKSRQEFWRQQRASRIPLQKKLLNNKQ